MYTEHAYFGLSGAIGEVKEAGFLKDGINYLVSAFTTTGVDARGWHSTEHRLVLLNPNLDTLSTQNLYYESEGEFNCQRPAYKFLGDSLLQVTRQRSYSDSYDSFTSYDFYKLQNQITPLNTKRHFAFTKYLKIDSSYFFGCFASRISDYTGKYNMIRNNHLLTEDLDLMVNEIYAEYGYTFKDPKWVEYFKGKEWYSPASTNVDDLLSEIDKYNIAYIRRYQKKLKLEQDKIIYSDSVTYHAVG